MTSSASTKTNIFLLYFQSTRQVQSGIYAQPKHVTKVSSFRNASPSKYSERLSFFLDNRTFFSTHYFTLSLPKVKKNYFFTQILFWIYKPNSLIKMNIQKG